MSSLRIDVYNKLKNSIIFGELSPGEKLSESDLSKKLKSSRTPIREAFRQLQMEGYINVVPNKGACVAKLPTEQVEEIYNVIALLEGYAGELATARISNIDIKELQRLHKKMDTYASQKKYQDYTNANTEFHNLIIRLSGNSTLIKINAELRMQVYRYRMISITIPGYLETYIQDHEKIIDAIRKKDAAGARNLIREHVDNVTKILVNFLRHNPGL
jgi:DNA-binding GntR family transcriptional regulator